MRITLDPTELAFADEVGRRRYNAARRHGYKHAHGATDTEMADIAGAHAEAAFRKMMQAPVESWNTHMGRGWTAAGADVAGWEVRSTDWRYGHLLLHDEDPDNAKFALVITTDDPSFFCPGWILAADGKLRQWWRASTGRPAFFVPQSALRPFGTASTPELTRCRILPDGRQGCGCITCRRELAASAG